MEEFEPVVRFYDPGERDPNGNRIPVVDFTFPWGKFQETILREHVVINSVTGARIPTPEAAIVAKHDALISPTSRIDKKDLDASDLRRLVQTVHARLDVPGIQTLASEVWPGGSDEILRFIECALTDKPIPVWRHASCRVIVSTSHGPSRQSCWIVPSSHAARKAD